MKNKRCLVILIRGNLEYTHCSHVEGVCTAILVFRRRLMWMVEISRDFIVFLLLPKLTGSTSIHLSPFFLYYWLINACVDRCPDFDLRKNFSRTTIERFETSEFKNTHTQPLDNFSIIDRFYNFYYILS